MIALSALGVAVFLCWVAIRTFQREAPVLYILIPVLLAVALNTGVAINAMLGHATADLSDLADPFVYLHHSGRDPVYLLAIPAGSAAPRLYAIPGTAVSAAARKGLEAAAGKARRRIPQTGRFAEGEMRFYDFAAGRLPPKDR